MIKNLTEIYRYCEGDITQIENFDKAINDRSDLYSHSNWVCHHRLETHNLDGSRREIQQSRDDLKLLDLYYHRPPIELIFLTRAEHNKVHTQGRRISNAQVEYLKNRSQKPVRCIEKDIVFPSMKEAAEWANTSISNMSNHLNKGKRHAEKIGDNQYHFEWALSENELNELRENIHYARQYYERSDGIIKGAFEWKELGFLQTSICRSIQLNKPYKGYMWKVRSYE